MDKENTKKINNQRLTMVEGIIINIKNCGCFGLTQIGKSFSLGGLIIGPVLLLICCALTYLGNHRLFEILDYQCASREKEYELPSKKPETIIETRSKSEDNSNKGDEAKKTVVTDTKNANEATIQQKQMEIKFKMAVSPAQLPDSTANASEFELDSKIEDTSFCRIVRRRMGIVFGIVTILLVLIEELTVIFFYVIFASEFWADSIFYNSQ